MNRPEFAGNVEALQQACRMSRTGSSIPKIVEHLRSKWNIHMKPHTLRRLIAAESPRMDLVDAEKEAFGNSLGVRTEIVKEAASALLDGNHVTEPLENYRRFNAMSKALHRAASDETKQSPVYISNVDRMGLEWYKVAAALAKPGTEDDEDAKQILRAKLKLIESGKDVSEEEDRDNEPSDATQDARGENDNGHGDKGERRS